MSREDERSPAGAPVVHQWYSSRAQPNGRVMLYEPMTIHHLRSDDDRLLIKINDLMRVYNTYLVLAEVAASR